MCSISNELYEPTKLAIRSNHDCRYKQKKIANYFEDIIQNMLAKVNILPCQYILFFKKKVACQQINRSLLMFFCEKVFSLLHS